MKTALILRLIKLSRKLENPGFEDSDMILLQKFDALSNAELLAIYDLTVTDAHRMGFL